MIPYLPAFPFNPKDVRFLGSPIDLVVFDGLAEGRVRRIVFLEVKTGGAGLTSRERSVRDVIQAREVEWAERERRLVRAASLRYLAKSLVGTPPSENGFAAFPGSVLLA